MAPLDNAVRSLEVAAESPFWTADELRTFSSHPGRGRVLHVRAGASEAVPAERCLEEAGYLIGRLPITRAPAHLPTAAATFGPDVIYVTLDQPLSLCLGALEVLANDPKTKSTPIVALVGEYAPSGIIDEAYRRTGCDFFRLGTTEVELLARTHILVRLGTHADEPGRARDRPRAKDANQPVGGRLDAKDPVTQVYTPTYLRDRLPTEVARAHRYSRPLSVLAVHAPAAGQRDAIASRVARQLAGTCRDVDIVARYNRDTFVMLLPETPEDGAETLRARLAKGLGNDGIKAGLGASTLGAGEGAAYTGGALVNAALARAYSC
ncbi:MAG: diguanylate cyclase [Myxococcota bacterium]